MRGPSVFMTLIVWVLAAHRVLTEPEVASGGVCEERISAGAKELQPILMQEVKERLVRLGEVSETKGSILRTCLSPAALRASRLIDQWMQDAGLRTWTDGVGNVHGRVDGPNPTEPALLLGSHMDTVRDAGKYDGLLGIISAIAAVKAFLKCDGSSRLRRPVEVIAFSDEEGVRFQSTFLGSSAIAGMSHPDIIDVRDAKGVTFGQVLESLGLDSTPEGVAAVKYDPDDVWAYVEAHIEQGPVLEDARTALGVVPAIAGQSRLQVVLEGKQGHAGTIPMHKRRDPMVAAAAAIVALEEICTYHAAPSATPGTPQEQEGVADSSGLVCTVGKLEVWPGATNVIPGKISFSIDVRARVDDARLGAVGNVTAVVTKICSQRHLRCFVELKHEAKAVECSPEITNQLEEAARAAMQELGGPRKGPPSVPRIVSGAGHDAMAMADLTKVAMLFVRCKGGVSHHPDEAVSDADILATGTALLLFLRSRPLSSPTPPACSTPR